MQWLWDTLVPVTCFWATCHQLNKFPVPLWWVVTFSWDTEVVTAGTWWQELYQAVLHHGRGEDAGCTVVALTQVCDPTQSPSMTMSPSISKSPMFPTMTLFLTCPHPCLSSMSLFLPQFQGIQRDEQKQKKKKN